MALTLKVVGPKAASLGPLDTQVFGVNGGTIGRAADNDWVLRSATSPATTRGSNIGKIATG